MQGDRYDFDWLVIGSGFGGSVSALRLAEKGYSVGVLECGRRFEDHEFARNTADARRYWWFPHLGMKGAAIARRIAPRRTKIRNRTTPPASTSRI